MWNKKVIIYGVGQIFEQYRECLNWDRVVALIDIDNRKQGQIFFEKAVYSLEKIPMLSYDYVVIFTEKHFEKIKNDLIGSFFVPEEKIVSWRIFFHLDGIISDERAQLYRIYIEEKNVKEILDVGNNGFRKCFFSNESFRFQIDSLGTNSFLLYRNFYTQIYTSVEQIKRIYDFVLLWENYGEMIKWKELERLARKYIIWTIPYCYKEDNAYLPNLGKLEAWGEKKPFLFSDAIVYVFEKRAEKRKLDCELFVVTHKRYCVLSNDLYKPICVGDQYENQEFYSEHIGENISYLNDRLNECTALYWIWKNTRSEFVGLSHYRRYFYNNKVKNYANYLTADRIGNIFDEGYDMIVPHLIRLPFSVLDNIKGSVGEELCIKALRIVRNLLEERTPGYAGAFEYVMAGNIFYKCNMFITRRTLLNSYCEWLFSFLIDGAELLDVSQCTAHQKRTMGFYAETLLTVWLLEQNLKLKELPVTDI